jgi:hypothetical protein
MKKLHLIIITSMLFGNTIINAQTIKTDKETFNVEGAYNFIITKTDNKTNKVLFKAETNIPDKSKKEAFFSGPNTAQFDLVGDNIFIVYDVWQKAGTKDCFIKQMNIKTGKFNEPKLIFSTPLNSKFSCGDIVYAPKYSPDKTKLVVIKNNVSPSYDIDNEIIIYDTKTLEILSKANLGQKYQNQKSVLNLMKTTLLDNGNMSVTFSQLNEKTKITTNTFSADLIFKESSLKNIKALDNNNSEANSSDNTSHGNFYKTLQDFANNKTIPGVRIKNGSYSWTVIGGSDFKLIDDAGNLKKEDTKDFPSDIFTYKRSNDDSPYLIRIMDKSPYIVLVVGKLSFYSLYLTQNELYFAEDWDGELKKFKENRFEEYLEKYNLIDEYKKDKPKREYKDDVNSYFNKTVAWRIKYFELLNKKM